MELKRFAYFSGWWCFQLNIWIYASGNDGIIFERGVFCFVNKPLGCSFNTSSVTPSLCGEGWRFKLSRWYLHKMSDMVAERVPKKSTEILWFYLSSVRKRRLSLGTECFSRWTVTQRHPPCVFGLVICSTLQKQQITLRSGGHLVPSRPNYVTSSPHHLL